MNEYCYGKNLLNQNQFSEAEKIFQIGKENGDARCVYGLLAVKASQGLDFSKELANLEEVFDQLYTMANAGDSQAMFIIGRCYETGTAIEYDLMKAVDYYTKSSELDNADAMFNLGCMYMQLGKCGHQTAQECFTHAAKREHWRAQKALEHLIEQGDGEQ